MTNKKAISKVVLAIIILVVVLAAGFGINFITKGGVGIIKPSEVTLSGNVTTTGMDTSPQMITFTSSSDGKTYIADAGSGSYSISLPNGDSYAVTITYKVLGFTGGTANAGTLNLDSTSSTMTKNWAG